VIVQGFRPARGWRFHGCAGRGNRVQWRHSSPALFVGTPGAFLKTRLTSDERSHDARVAGITFVHTRRP
jgi:hypothetical protein